jgi:hypothetical protein
MHAPQLGHGRAADNGVCTTHQFCERPFTAVNLSEPASALPRCSPGITHDEIMYRYTRPVRR